MLKKTLLGLTALALLGVVGALVAAATRPDDFRYERTAVIAAPAATVHAQIDDLHKFQAWNPWATIDPDSQVTFAGPASGVGASFSWAGNSDVGAGTMTIVESKPGELVRCRMDFKAPMEGTSTADFTLEPAPGGTKLTWALHGPNPFLGKVMSLFIDCDKMCGDQFERGFASLRTVVEPQPQS